MATFAKVAPVEAPVRAGRAATPIDPAMLPAIQESINLAQNSPTKRAGFDIMLDSRDSHSTFVNMVKAVCEKNGIKYGSRDNYSGDIYVSASPRNADGTSFNPAKDKGKKPARVLVSAVIKE